MSVLEQTIRGFTSGVHNKLQDELIPRDAASDSMNWVTNDGSIHIAPGRALDGAAGASGKIWGEHVGYRVDGTPVRFRKAGTKIQAKVSGTWTDVITGLTETADYTFANYSSLAGAFVYIFGPDGLYKICTANPTSFASLYNAAKNFKGYGIIDKGRTFLWGRKEDPTGLYGSYIDGQDGTVYTTVTGEATASLSGTLAFKAGGATRTCFGVKITVGSEVFTDNYNGVLTGSAGGTGTINYMTGAYTVSVAGAGTAEYQWEDSNAKGVTDFTKSGTRLAGEGFVVRQDIGGDAIKLVIPLEGEYFSQKASSVYRFALDATDLNPVNEVYRTDVGITTLRSATATSQGIVFMNTANPSEPRLEVLQRNPLGDNFTVTPLFPHFEFKKYDMSDVAIDTWDRFIVISCKEDSDDNNRLLLCDPKTGTVDVTYYGVRSFAKAGSVLYGGDSVSQTSYELMSGIDDLGIAIENSWEGNGETFGSDVLKAVKRRRIKGLIDPNQTLEVYEAYDDGDFTLIGTILGSGDYVDYTASYALGTVAVGEYGAIGGGATPVAYSFFAEIKVRGRKFRKRKVRFVAKGIGFVSVSQYTDFDIWTYQDKMPVKYRLKQNVSLTGTPVDMAEPNY